MRRREGASKQQRMGQTLPLSRVRGVIALLASIPDAVCGPHDGICVRGERRVMLIAKGTSPLSPFTTTAVMSWLVRSDEWMAGPHRRWGFLPTRFLGWIPRVIHTYLPSGVESLTRSE